MQAPGRERLLASAFSFQRLVVSQRDHRKVVKVSKVSVHVAATRGNRQRSAWILNLHRYAPDA
jgi:hypothetical protein